MGGAFKTLGYAPSRLPDVFARVRRHTLARLNAARGTRKAGPRSSTTRAPRVSLEEARRQVEAKSGTGYVWIRDENTVDPILRRHAGAGRSSAMSRLGAATAPSMQYFRRARSGERPDFQLGVDVRGFAAIDADMIAVSIEQTPAQAREAAAHEVRHVVGGDEGEASAFGQQYLDRPVDVWSRRP